jgi:hypothetical protein
VFRSAESLSLFITAVSAAMLMIAVATSEATPAGDTHTLETVDVSTGVPLKAIQNPAEVLPSMAVETSAGEQLGHVRSVDLGPDGAIESVTVATRGWFGLTTVTATLSADDLVYVRDRNSLASRLTPTEIAARAEKRVKIRHAL